MEKSIVTRNDNDDIISAMQKQITDLQVSTTV